MKELLLSSSPHTTARKGGGIIKTMASDQIISKVKMRQGGQVRPNDWGGGACRDGWMEGENVERNGATFVIFRLAGEKAKKRTKKGGTRKGSQYFYLKQKEGTA